MPFFGNGGNNTDPRTGQPYSAGRRFVNTAFPAVGMFLRWRDNRQARRDNTPMTPGRVDLTGQPNFSYYGPGVNSSGVGGAFPGGNALAGNTIPPPSNNLQPQNTNYYTPGAWSNGYGTAGHNINSAPNRLIGGTLSFGNGHFNNGVGAGTGYGATNYRNDSWGDTASGFGIGATGNHGPSAYAISDALRAAAINRI